MTKKNNKQKKNRKEKAKNAHDKFWTSRRKIKLFVQKCSAKIAVYVNQVQRRIV